MSYHPLSGELNQDTNHIRQPMGRNVDLGHRLQGEACKVTSEALGCSKPASPCVATSGGSLEELIVGGGVSATGVMVCIKHFHNAYF